MISSSVYTVCITAHKIEPQRQLHTLIIWIWIFIQSWMLIQNFTRVIQVSSSVPAIILFKEAVSLSQPWHLNCKGNLECTLRFGFIFSHSIEHKPSIVDYMIHNTILLSMPTTTFKKRYPFCSHKDWAVMLIIWFCTVSPRWTFTPNITECVIHDCNHNAGNHSTLTVIFVKQTIIFSVCSCLSSQSHMLINLASLVW